MFLSVIRAGNQFFPEEIKYDIIVALSFKEAVSLPGNQHKGGAMTVWQTSKPSAKESCLCVIISMHLLFGGWLVVSRQLYLTTPLRRYWEWKLTGNL